MTTTPPRTSMRVRTPPTPLHGPQYDNYEPYSPRRSKRSTAQSNPYSSLNGERSPKSSFSRSTPPPTTVKKARFARAPTQLSSPPSSPVSPVERQASHKTPRKSTQTRTATANFSDSDGPGPSNSLTSLAPSTIDPVTMLPTPSKTPNKKRPAASLTSARILNFQPHHPNDVMPSPRSIKKQRQRQHTGTAGFELYEDGGDAKRKGEQIEIYTDANARVPELDESEDNPFVGRRRREAPKPQSSRRRRRPAEEVEMEERMKEAVKREEGVTYVFRGKKIFRPFTTDAEEANADNNSATSSLGAAPEQRRLRHQAGATAQRPLTRSAIKPRLLFPSEEQVLERERARDDGDEEADTDIEMGNVISPVAVEVTEEVITPVEETFAAVTTPPSTIGKVRGKGKKRSVTASPPSVPVVEEEDDVGVTSVGVAQDDTPVVGAARRKGRSPFDGWQRTKASAGRKRAGEAVEGGERGREGMVCRVMTALSSMRFGGHPLGLSHTALEALHIAMSTWTRGDLGNSVRVSDWVALCNHMTTTFLP